MHTHPCWQSLKLFLICLLLSACPISEHPLGPQSKAKYHKQLKATWIGGKKPDQAELFISSWGKNEIEILATSIEKGKLAEELYRGHGNQLDKEFYLSVKEVKNGKPQGDYYLIHYRIKGNELQFAIASEAYFERAITSKKIQGVVTASKVGKLNVNNARVTAGSDELAAFVKKHRSEIFSHYESLRRKP